MPSAYSPTAISTLAAQLNGWVPYHLIAAGSNNATVLKAFSGEVGFISVFNLAAAACYVKFYDKATAPVVGTDIPVHVTMAPGNTAGAGAVESLVRPIVFANGISFAIVTGIADSDTTGVAANNVVLNLGTR